MHQEADLKIPPCELIDDAECWETCLKDLQQESRLALDIEADSLYVYREKVCLIQISTDEKDYIVDPLADFSLHGLGEILADKAVEKVFHASEYDLILLKREYDWDVHNLFDTMWAARILGYKNMGLAWFLKNFYGVTLSKKYQKANWAIRPLTKAHLEYAQKDTCFLLRLRDELEAQLIEAGHLEEAREIFENESQVRIPKREFDPEAFWNIKGARDLSPRQLAIFRKLYLLREEEAQESDLPPFKVINNQVLIKLAEAAPQNRQELRAFKGLSARSFHRLGDRILLAIAAGQKAPVPKPKARTRKKKYSQEVSDRYERLMQWRKQCAQERGVESDVILTRQTMWEIAQNNPSTMQALAKIPSMGTKRLELLGEGILKEISRNDA